MGATFEGVIVTQALYEGGGRNTKFRPVVFHEEDARFIPSELRRFNRYGVDSPEHYENLLRWLHGAPKVDIPILGAKPNLLVEPAPMLFPGKVGDIGKKIARDSAGSADPDKSPKRKPDHPTGTNSVTSEQNEISFWCRAVVRVWCGPPPERGEFLGSAFFVSSDKLLTAFNVVDKCNAEKSKLILEGPALDGGFRRVTEVHSHPRADVAILVAPPGLSASSELWIPWHEDSEPTLVGGNTELILIGYGSNELVIQPAATFDRNDGGSQESNLLAGLVAGGMSGGPAFSGVRLVGVTHAHNGDRGPSYVVPIACVQAFLRQFGIAPAALEVAQHRLHEYPLFVPFGTERLNPSLWKGYAKVIPLGEESEVIYEADKERLAADPGLDEAFLLRDAQLPDPYQNREFYWRVTFQTALRRSGRMLAALLFAVDEDRLPREAASARRELLDALRQETRK
jgi:hypothetical protein